MTIPKVPKPKTPHELNIKLKNARESAKRGDIKYCCKAKSLSELAKEAITQEEFERDLLKYLDEITFEDACEKDLICYEEPHCVGEPLYHFAWDSAHFGRRMYIKFAIRKNKRTEELTYWHVAFHTSKYPKPGRQS